MKLDYGKGHCSTCGTNKTILRPFKICDSCRAEQSTYNEYCEKCGEELEKINYETKLNRNSFFQTEIVKVGE